MLKVIQQKGFTLVELAIVLVIVGLLIGGILKGQQLMQNSRVTTTVAQIKGIEAATTNFRDVYGGLPGDLKNSVVKIPGCNTGDIVCESANADGAIGDIEWDMFSYQPANWVALTNEERLEPLLFWYSLSKAGLLSGVTEDAKGDLAVLATPAFNKTVPAAKIGGGFWAGNSLNGDGNPAAGNDTDGRPNKAGKFTLLGTVITLVKKPGSLVAGAGDLDFAKKKGPVTPAVAANIDRKLDDGLPNSGSVQAYGDTSDDGSAAPFNQSCYGPDPLDDAYQENEKDLDCGVHVRIQQ